MGHGRSNRPEVSKRVSTVAISDLSASDGQASAPSAEDGDAVCERIQTVAFEATAEMEPQIGMDVWLAIGNPPEVRSAAGAIGRVAPPAAHEMAGCLRLGYAMAGLVTSFNRESSKGTLEIAGRRPVAT